MDYLKLITFFKEKIKWERSPLGMEGGDLFLNAIIREVM
jgi:hypothetical protein